MLEHRAVFVLCQLMRLHLLVFLLATAAFAQQGSGPQVKATVSPTQARPNQQVAFSVTITGGKPDSLPNLRLPLQLQQTSSVSQGQQISIVNGVASTRFTLTWALVGTEPGDFVIPPQEVLVGGQMLQTNEVQFKVTQAQTIPPPGSSANKTEEAFLQLEVGKTEIYQGELVPLSASLFVPRQMGLRRFGLIDINKDDFAIQRFPQQAEQSLEVIGNTGYNVFIFRSTLSALRTGDLKIGPAKQELLVEIQGQDAFGRAPFGFPFAEPQKLDAVSQQIPVKVLPLPAEGKPANFSGAVGRFTLEAAASPTDGLKVGDPISIDLTVSGSGNFDALVEPKLSKPDGWKTYPTRRFNAEGQADPVLQPSVERTINYATVIVPQKAHTMVPSFELSFFDPDQKKYVVLETPPIPLKIEAPAPVAASPDSGPAGTDAPAEETPPPVLAPRAEISDILADIPAKAEWIAPPALPLLQQPLFWAAQGLPVLALALALAGRAAARRRARLQAGRTGQIRQAWTDLGRSGLDDHEFLRRATQFLLVATESGSDGPDHPEYAALLKRYATHNFAVPGQPAEPLSSSERQRILQTLGQLKSESLTSFASADPAKVTAVLLAACLLPGLLPAQTPKDPDATYQKALEAFQAGKFKDAQYHAESLVKDPASAALSPQLFELIGHARYRSGDLGRAALWYRRAEFFTPRDPELRQNLRHLDERLRFLSFQSPSPLHEWSLKLGQNEWALLAAGGFWLLLLPLAWLVLSRRLRLTAGLLSLLGAIVLTTAVVFLLVRPGSRQRVENVSLVTAKDIRAHPAAAATSGSVIDLPPGSAARVLEVRGAWSYCELPYQPEPLRGWVENSALTPLWPYDPALIP